MTIPPALSLSIPSEKKDQSHYELRGGAARNLSGAPSESNLTKKQRSCTLCPMPNYHIPSPFARENTKTKKLLPLRRNGEGYRYFKNSSGPNSASRKILRSRERSIAR